jgi:hypothetical protein
LEGSIAKATAYLNFDNNKKFHFKQAGQKIDLWVEKN